MAPDFLFYGSKKCNLWGPSIDRQSWNIKT